MNIDSHAYNISIRRGLFDDEELYEARVKELPDVAAYGEASEEAYELALDAIETTAEIFSQKDRAMPAPWKPVDDYSGRVTLRLPKSLHHSLATAADEEGVSLNQHIVSVLAHFSGYEAGRRGDNSSDWKPMDNIRAPQAKKIDRNRTTRLVQSTSLDRQVSSWS